MAAVFGATVCFFTTVTASEFFLLPDRIAAFAPSWEGEPAVNAYESGAPISVANPTTTRVTAVNFLPYSNCRFILKAIK
jgi:hypothetical protein